MHIHHFSARGFLWDLIRECAISLARADRAMKEGKALEQLRERASSLNGIEEMHVEDTDRARTTNDVEITLAVSRSLSSQEQSLIQRALDEVNRRFGTRLRISVVPRTKR
jgi:hypothetical protein